MTRAKLEKEIQQIIHDSSVEEQEFSLSTARQIVSLVLTKIDEDWGQVVEWRQQDES